LHTTSSVWVCYLPLHIRCSSVLVLHMSLSSAHAAFCCRSLQALCRNCCCHQLYYMPNVALHASVVITALLQLAWRAQPGCQCGDDESPICQHCEGNTASGSMWGQYIMSCCDHSPAPGFQLGAMFDAAKQLFWFEQQRANCCRKASKQQIFTRTLA